MNTDIKAGWLLHNSKRMLGQQAHAIPVMDADFAQQDKFVQDGETFITGWTTRRAGKSTGLALKYFRSAQKHPGRMLPYIALTRDSAKAIMWPILKELNTRFKLGAEPIESKLEMVLPNKAVIKLYGANMSNFIERLRGIKTPFAAIDEAQSFRSHIGELVDDILTPAISDFGDGQLAVTGTPGPVPKGFFHDVCQGRGGFNVHRWTVYQNPYMPNIKAFVDKLKIDKGWTDDHPTYRREWLGEWCADPDALVFQYNSISNAYWELPRVNYRYVIGVDVGFDDADAIAVLAYSEQLKEVYLVDELIKTKQGITELAQQLERMIKQYGPEKMVIDAGGLGKKIAEELRKRYALPIVAAEKSRKFEYIEILNDAMRTKRFYAKTDSRFATDATMIEWDYEHSTPERMVVSNAFHSDIADAVLYAFRECLHWLYEEPRIKTKPGTPEWLKEQEQEMEAQAIRHAAGDQEDQWANEPIGWEEEW